MQTRFQRTNHSQQRLSYALAIHFVVPQISRGSFEKCQDSLRKRGEEKVQMQHRLVYNFKQYLNQN